MSVLLECRFCKSSILVGGALTYSNKGLRLHEENCAKATQKERADWRKNGAWPESLQRRNRMARREIELRAVLQARQEVLAQMRQEAKARRRPRRKK